MNRYKYLNMEQVNINIIGSHLLVSQIPMSPCKVDVTFPVPILFLATDHIQWFSSTWTTLKLI